MSWCSSSRRSGLGPGPAQGFAVSERGSSKWVLREGRAPHRSGSPGVPVPSALLRCPPCLGSGLSVPRQLGRTEPPSKPRGRLRVYTCPKATITRCLPWRRTCGQPGWWLHARSPPRGGSSAVHIHLVSPEQVPASRRTTSCAVVAVFLFRGTAEWGQRDCGSTGFRVCFPEVCSRWETRTSGVRPCPLLPQFSVS